MESLKTPDASFDELIDLGDADFVKRAYLEILDRPADDDGLRNYVRQLRRGRRKLEILRELVESEEGRAKGALLAGKEEALAIHAAGASSGRRRRLLTMLLTGSQERDLTELDVTIRIVANHLHRIERSMRDDLLHMSAKLDRLLAIAERSDSGGLPGHAADDSTQGAKPSANSSPSLSRSSGDARWDFASSAVHETYKDLLRHARPSRSN
jgi:hypothetical protein